MYNRSKPRLIVNSKIWFYFIQINWIKNNNFPGFMVWAPDLDDFAGSFCNQGKYPLLTAMNNIWSSGTM